MSEEKFDYEEYAQSMYEQSLALMPEDIGVGDKEYLATTVKQFFLMSAESMSNEYSEFGIDTILFAAQVIAEWTYNKGIDIIRADISKEYRDGILQKIAFIAYETLKNNIRKGASQEILLEKVEKDINKNFYESINELCLKKCITERAAKKIIELSHDDSINSRINSSQANNGNKESQYENYNKLTDSVRIFMNNLYKNELQKYQISPETKIKESEELCILETCATLYNFFASDYPDLSDEDINYLLQIFADNIIEKALKIIILNISEDIFRRFIWQLSANILEEEKKYIKRENYTQDMLEKNVSSLTNEIMKNMLVDLVQHKQITEEEYQKVILEEQFTNNDENAIELQEKIQMQEDQRNYWINQIENEPDNPEGYVYISEIERQNNPKKALKYINKAIELDINNSRFYIQRALIYKEIANISTYNTASMEELFELSSVPYEKEIADLTKALSMDIGLKDAIFYERGLAYQSILEEDNAANDFKAAIKVNPNFAKPYYELARIKIKREQYHTAIEYLDKAIELLPDCSVLYLSRGEAKEKGGNIEGAKEDYKKALELNPEDDRAEYQLDCIESLENQDKEFNIEYEKCTKYIIDNPNDPDGYFNRGYLLSCNDVDDNIALSDFDKAIELNPDYVEAYRQKTYIYERSGQYEKIIPIYKKIVELEATIENYDYFIRYLNTYIENGSQIALEVCEKIFESFPVCDKLYELRGSTYYYLKDYDNAIADYKKAIELCPNEDTWYDDYLRMTLKQIEQEKKDNV